MSGTEQNTAVNGRTATTTRDAAEHPRRRPRLDRGHHRRTVGDLLRTATRGRRRGLTAVVAGVITSLLAILGLAGPASAGGGHDKPTVVIVHGAWTDAGSFSEVQQRLQQRGYPVLDFANPLRSLSGDSAALALFLQHRTSGPVVLVGHSYGGAVITEAATSDPDVRALVYVDAFVPEKGESLLALLSSAGPVDPSALFDMVPYPGAPEGDVDLYLQEAAFHATFANGLPRKERDDLYARQRPITFSAVNEAAANEPAWTSLPSWYVAGTEDGSIPLELQERMASRAGAELTTVKAGHLAMTRHPTAVAKVIEQAAAATDHS
ncbi:alpha/beta fold hydrolase [Modestobacter sp. VKM Ac-2978]|uniref:alpha/beta fold hydrolase n=1 Tax=Modestobacter sp. VKM Ac-2978 TaxID=3004132 RepID=UPI0022AA6FB7|nr:alpha/beta hydrolase [Modestobacter sp. VKM Ac-2978]MCZ2848523.1 alpha/beta hydrolase [Modestobacter sp. VKM Ac-2978]